MTEVTFLGFVHGTLAALKRMLPRDRGIVVQVGSALAYRSIPLQSAYCAAKHAIAGFSDSLRCELLHDRSRVKVTMVQMPAMNTRQFDWVKTRLQRKPQPVPRIYQPEVAAEVVYRAAHAYRREWFVGSPTVVAIQGNKLAPGLGDWYLARQGYDAQQYNGPTEPDRPNNLDRPLDQDRDWGTHGDFDRRSRTYSAQVWLDENRGWVGVAGAALAGGLAAIARGGKFWRGGLLGGTLAGLAAWGLSALPWRDTTKRWAIVSRPSGTGWLGTSTILALHRWPLVGMSRPHGEEQAGVILSKRFQEQPKNTFRKKSSLHGVCLPPFGNG